MSGGADDKMKEEDNECRTMRYIVIVIHDNNSMINRTYIYSYIDIVFLIFFRLSSLGRYIYIIYIYEYSIIRI